MISDLHLEFGSYLDIEPKCKYLMLLGDIGLPLINNDYFNFLKEVAQKFELVFLVLGNHEFYSSKME